MVAIGALARSFKEAQTLLTPVYFLCMAPALTAGLGDFQLGGVTAWIPGVGVTLLARDLILGHASLGVTLAVLASTALYGAAALALAARLYDSERLFFTDEAGLGLGAWLRHVVGGRGRRGRRSRRARTTNHRRPGTRSPSTRSPASSSSSSSFRCRPGGSDPGWRCPNGSGSAA